jgi:hypothetical protein
VSEQNVTIDGLAPRGEVVFGMVNYRGEQITIPLKDVKGWLRLRHPILWRRNADLRNFFKEWS